MHEENYASRFKYSARRLKKKGVCLFQAQKIYAIKEHSKSVPYLKSFPMDFTSLVFLKALALPEKSLYPDFSISIRHEPGYFSVDFDTSPSFIVRYEIILCGYANFHDDMEYDRSRALFQKLAIWVKDCRDASTNRKTEARKTEAWRNLSQHVALKLIAGSVLHACITDFLYELHSTMPRNLVTELSPEDYISNDLESLDVYRVRHFDVKVRLGLNDL